MNITTPSLNHSVFHRHTYIEAILPALDFGLVSWTSRISSTLYLERFSIDVVGGI